MNEGQNKQEVEWLRREPDRLLKHYQFIVEAVVARFIGRGFFRPEEKMEIVQEINVELLEKKLARMQEQYNGSVYLRTYFSKVVYNSCLELARRSKREPRAFLVEELPHNPSPERSAFEVLAIRDELMRLEALLKGHRQYYKLRLCLKLWARCPLRQEDWQFFDGPKTGNAAARLKEQGNKPELTGKEAFEMANELFNLLENKHTDGDSLRRWVQQQADGFIALLNGHPPTSQYNRETFKILLRYYFE